jgi:clan AA aspartic protease (TIGR02281 family)
MSYSQDVKQPDTYNYNRALESLRNENLQEALDYFNKEIGENPKNGYAFLWRAFIHETTEEYGDALTAINQAIKHIPQKDSKYLAFAYSIRSEVYAQLEDIDKAIEDISTAIKYESNNEDWYEKRGQLYYEANKNDLSNKDYEKIIEMNEGSVMGYMGIGRNANKEERFADAVKQFNYVIKMHPDYSSGYSFRAESYTKMGKYNEAIDDVIKALDIDKDSKAFHWMQQLADSAFVPLVSKLKVQQTKAPANAYWPYCLGIVHERQSFYAKAIGFYKKYMEIETSAPVAYRIANCFDDLGLYDQALTYCEQAIALDSSDEDYILLKANIEDNAGMTKEAIADIGLFISKSPEYFWGYYRRGWFKDHSGDLKGALEDYSVAITLMPDYAYAYLNRGIVNDLLKNKDTAMLDFKQTIELDSIPDDNSCAQYAYYYIGQKEKAIKWMDEVLKQNDSAGNYYDAACLYSVMNEKEKALSYLRSALEKGYKRFVHIRRDRDLNNIRELSEFNLLLKEYEQKQDEILVIDAEEQGDYFEKIVEIPFVSEDGVCKVECKINDLPLHFIFDTGASDVSMSTVEATFMLKNKYLSYQDIIGKQNYMNATGEISEGTVVNLRNVSFGGLNLNNVKASIVKSQNAPLLLGQSILNKLGTIEIINQRKVLKVTYKEKK